MKRILLALSALVVLFFSHITFAKEVIISVRICLNGTGALSCQDANVYVYSSAQQIAITPAVSRVYPNMGIKINTGGYSVEGCTQHSNGYCIFGASPAQPMVLKIRGPSAFKAALSHPDSPKNEVISKSSVQHDLAAFFTVQSIIHPISIQTIQPQQATIGVDFKYDLLATKAVDYYEENKNYAESKNPEAIPKGFMSQDDLNGLHQLGLEFDPNNFVISGTPNSARPYSFKVGVKKGSSGGIISTDFTINVKFNLTNTPVYKTQYEIPSAIPTQHYQLNLMDLLEKKAGFNTTNQVSFEIVKDEFTPEWLEISKTEANLLVGEVPPNAAGTHVQVTVKASSNTGGPALPFTLTIPVTFDPTLQPTIEYFEMRQLAGNHFNVDVSKHVINPTNDASLKVVLDKIEIENPWSYDSILYRIQQKNVEIETPQIYISNSSPTALEGTIAPNATGQKYLLTLHAETASGGPSKTVIVPLQIDIDTGLTPRFSASHPHFPMLYPGQDYEYDFVEHRDVLPEYEDVPYEIQFAKDFIPPYWLKLENNKLTASAKDIPVDLDWTVELGLIIKNIPGGSSKKITVYLPTAAN